LRAIGGSSLTDARIPVREGEPEKDRIPTSYVPFRNAHLLAAATSWGEVLGARAIFVGAVEQDSSGYPDCRPAFYRAYEEAIRLGTRPETSIRIETPVIGLSKADIVRRGIALRVPFDKTWSCYQAESEACGACESCRLRLRGFAEAGVTDPIPYRAAGGDAREEVRG
jgi:7-cyano-7-deazaguanine synthase